MAKRTLRVDDAVVSRAKRRAERHKVSVSSMLPAVLSSVRGILKSADAEHHRRYLAKKYQ